MNGRFMCDSKCRFCDIFINEREVDDIDRPIVKSDNYMAIASIGAIVEGWTLIIPYKHIYSMKEFYKDKEFIQFTNEVIHKINKAYNRNCIVFEHGANCEGSLISCGTNHAHLHIVPYDNSLLSNMKNDNRHWMECSSVEIGSIVKEKEYWFYAENVEQIEDTKGYLHIIENGESQYFRKIIAEKENCKELFSYKEFEFIENTKSTYEKLSR